MDNRTTQMALPFDFKGKDMKPYVQQHWNITFSRQRKVSVFAKRIMANVMAQIKNDHQEFRPYYQLHVTDILNHEQHEKSVYKEVKGAFDELTDLKWLIEDIEAERFAYRHLINTTHADCGYNKGTITVALNPLLKPYFLALAHYTTYELKWYMTFTSWYSMRLFELLSAFKDTGHWMISIDEYRKLMDCEDKYKRVPDLVKYTTSEPLEELKKTDLAFSVDYIKDPDPKRAGRKPIVGLHFKLDKAQPVEIPEEWYTFSKEHREVLLKLKNKYQVTEKNIMRYAKSITLKGCKDLLAQWEQKENANRNRIDDKLRYCNSVFVKVGKQALGYE